MEAYGPRNEDEHTWRVLDAVKSVADATGGTQAAVALAWLDAQPGVTSTILGARTVEQLQQNLAAVDLDLGADALGRLTEVSTPRTEVYPYGPQAVQQRFRPLVP
jgi:aryl-alcohol dehydrogenase (NADP+)